MDRARISKLNTEQPGTGFSAAAALAGNPEIRVVVEVSRAFRPDNDAGDLRLAFGSFEAPWA
jgi:hypothetical protein